MVSRFAKVLAAVADGRELRLPLRLRSKGGGGAPSLAPTLTLGAPTLSFGAPTLTFGAPARSAVCRGSFAATALFNKAAPFIVSRCASGRHSSDFGLGGERLGLETRLGCGEPEESSIPNRRLLPTDFRTALETDGSADAADLFTGDAADLFAGALVLCTSALKEIS